MTHPPAPAHRPGWVHRNFLPLLAGAYLLAAAAPQPADAARAISVGCGTGRATVPTALLAVLLFNAGLGTRAADAMRAVRRPLGLSAGLVGSVLAPLAPVAALAWTLGAWHDPAEARCLVAGLALVAAMPVAGSSVGWAQAAGGSPAVSVGLVLASTALSPLTTPVALWALRPVAGDGLATVAGGPTPGFLVGWVVVPTAAGLLARAALGPDRGARWVQPARTINGPVLLVLCYLNAAAALPTVAADPDWDYLALAVAAAGLMSAFGFAAGAAVGRAARLDHGERVALTYGLGMSNNGTALVAAGSACAGVPNVLVVVVVYNLIQHIAAGTTARLLAAGPNKIHVAPPARGTIG